MSTSRPPTPAVKRLKTDGSGVVPSIGRAQSKGGSQMQRVLALTATVALGGCAATLAYTPVPEFSVSRAEVTGYSNIRAWGDSSDEVINRMMPAWASQGGKTQSRTFLALSGGGSDGAYAAGLLVGWTASGQRPAFDIVTGVSTGALAAPFAFLGPAYDKALEAVYTRFETKDLGNPQIFSAVLGGPSLVDASGLERLLVHYVNEALITKVAQEHARGRRLLVATTNVEAERQVIWNLGAIAASQNPKRLDLFRRILLASSAIPGILPPVLVSVTVDGREYQELHADGGMVGQVFFVPQAGRAQSARAQLYVIRNGKIGPAWQSNAPTSFQIAKRSLETLIKNQARGDVERLYAQAKANGIAFRLAAIPSDFAGVSTEPFDKSYMLQLFDVGYVNAKHGFAWAPEPYSNLAGPVAGAIRPSSATRVR